jgi:2-methylisocitrate lyase-like PEP mutase family enzyme
VTSGCGQLTGGDLVSVSEMTTQFTTGQARQAELFASLHRAGDPLLLANAWDVASAVVVAAAGAKAIATTSAGVAWSLGVPDGADLGAERAAAVISRIAAAVSLPVSADIEAGYGDSPDAVAATVAAVVAAGAVGVNLEDRRDRSSLFGPSEQADRLAAARAAAATFTSVPGGAAVWINARTDIFLTGAYSSASAGVAAALERAAAYKAAGADSLFVPGLADLAAIAELAAGPLPVAVMVWPGAPTVAELTAAGAVRISLGSAVAQAAYGVAARAAAELFTVGTYDSSAGGFEYGTMNDALTL